MAREEKRFALEEKERCRLERLKTVKVKLPRLVQESVDHAAKRRKATAQRRQQHQVPTLSA